MSGSHPRVTTSSTVARQRVAAVLAAALVVLATVATAPSARAQSSYGRTMSLSAFGGYNIASDIYNGTSGVNSASLELKNAFMWGARATAYTSQFSAAEFTYTRNQSDLAVRTSTGSPIPSGFDAGSLSADQYDLNFLVSQPSPNPKMWPYFTVGFGWTVTHPEVHTVDPSKTVSIKSNSLFAFNFGLGTMVELSNPQLQLRLDARWRVTDTAITTSSGVYCDYWGYCWSYASDWYNSGELTAGLTYKLKR